MDILLVDDTKLVQQNLTELLASHGHSVDTAKNGLDGLSKAQVGDYDLFIIDHLMPVMNGIQLFKNLKTSSALNETKVIFITTQSEATLKTLPEYPHFDAVMEKPLNKVLLLNLIESFAAEMSLCELT